MDRYAADLIHRPTRLCLDQERFDVIGLLIPLGPRTSELDHVVFAGFVPSFLVVVVGVQRAPVRPGDASVDDREGHTPSSHPHKVADGEIRPRCVRPPPTGPDASAFMTKLLNASTGSRRCRSHRRCRPLVFDQEGLDIVGLLVPLGPRLGELHHVVSPTFVPGFLVDAPLMFTPFQSTAVTAPRIPCLTVSFQRNHQNHQQTQSRCHRHRCPTMGLKMPRPRQTFLWIVAHRCPRL